MLVAAGISHTLENCCIILRISNCACSREEMAKYELSHICYENEIALVSVGRTRNCMGSRGTTKIEFHFKRDEKSGVWRPEPCYE